ncbi:MAG: isoprenylcysteine carboxylmethyltransferase family protein [Alphaproteobacteria bacterium]|nr:isoprenylcysteine carboxylmethyltransferase family protein [Alphaproteobacteria bacterium]
MNEPQNPIKNDNSSADSDALMQGDSPVTNIDENHNAQPEKNEGPEEELISAHPESNSILSYINDLITGYFLTNLLLAGLFANNIYLFYHDYNINLRFSSLLMMIQVCCVALFFLIRVAPTKFSMKPMDWGMAILGTCLPMLIAPVSADNEIVFLMLMQFFGIFMATVAIISLNTSFAVVPALRNIKTGGLYSIIRHPIYFSYFLTFTCVVLQNFSMLNVVILLALYATDIYRIKAEEKILSEDPSYELYKMQVRYRLIPFVW